MSHQHSTAHAAQEFTYNLGTPDYSLAFELSEQEAEEAEKVERQALNVAYGEWLGMY